MKCIMCINGVDCTTSHQDYPYERDHMCGFCDGTGKVNFIRWTLGVINIPIIFIAH